MLQKEDIEEQRRWSLFLSGTGSQTWNKSCWMLTCGIRTADKVVQQPREMILLGRVCSTLSSFLPTPCFWEPQLYPQGHQVILQVCPGSLWQPSCDNQNGCLSLISQLAFLQCVCGLILRPWIQDIFYCGMENKECQSGGIQEWSRCWSRSHVWSFSACTWEKHLISF